MADKNKLLEWLFFDEVIQYQFDQEPKFERPNLFDEDLEIVVESNVDTVMEVNICRNLNILAGPYYKFSKQKDLDLKRYDLNIGNCKPDYTCRMFAISDEKIIMPIEVKRQIVLEELVKNRQLFLTNSIADRLPYTRGSVSNAIRQI